MNMAIIKKNNEYGLISIDSVNSIGAFFSKKFNTFFATNSVASSVYFLIF